MLPVAAGGVLKGTSDVVTCGLWAMAGSEVLSRVVETSVVPGAIRILSIVLLES